MANLENSTGNYEASNESLESSMASKKFQEVFKSVCNAQDYKKDGYQISFSASMTKWLPVEQIITISRVKGKWFPEKISLSKVEDKFKLTTEEPFWPETTYDDVAKKDVITKILPMFERRVQESAKYQLENLSKENNKKEEEENNQAIQAIEKWFDKMD